MHWHWRLLISIMELIAVVIIFMLTKSWFVGIIARATAYEKLQDKSKKGKILL